jgi:hypothetical protein
MPLARIDIHEDAPSELVRIVSDAIYGGRVDQSRRHRPRGLVLRKRRDAIWTEVMTGMSNRSAPWAPLLNRVSATLPETRPELATAEYSSRRTR